MGVSAARAFARHRLARVPYIGLPRMAVVARMRRGAMRPERQPVVDIGLSAFEAFQAHAPGAVVGAA